MEGNNDFLSWQQPTVSVPWFWEIPMGCLVGGQESVILIDSKKLISDEAT